MRDSYLLDAGWLFFIAWSVVVLVVSWAAFRGDLFPTKALDARENSGSPQVDRPRTR